MNLGERVTDPVTGFTGTVTARAEYLGESPQVRVTAETGAAGDLKERWLGEGRVQATAEARAIGLGQR